MDSDHFRFVCGTMYRAARDEWTKYDRYNAIAQELDAGDPNDVLSAEQIRDLFKNVTSATQEVPLPEGLVTRGKLYSALTVLVETLKESATAVADAYCARCQWYKTQENVKQVSTVPEVVTFLPPY